MLFLISNDDGYHAEGIQHLQQVLSRMGDVVVVAPDRDRSGASNSLTLDRPLLPTRAANGYIYVNGTPTDCVHLALTGLLDHVPDMVVSGINSGANLGDDVLYSGTVAVAMEGRFFGLPAIAVSLVGKDPEHYDTAARITELLVTKMRSHPLPTDTILNVNIPDVAWADLAGIKATRLGLRHKSEPVIKQTNPRGQTIFWVGPPGPEEDAGEGTDFFAVKHGYVSVTPLMVDLTRHSAIPSISQWLTHIDEP